jgi:hypothetical protein
VEEQNLEEEAFAIAPYMREWWQANYAIPTEADRTNMDVI